MILIDSSILVRVVRDETKFMARRFKGLVRRTDWAITPFTKFELLCGCRDDDEFDDLLDYLDNQRCVGADDLTWVNAARMYGHLRSLRIVIRSKLDCCIAQVAIANDLPLYHLDADFERIASVYPLRQHRINDR